MIVGDIRTSVWAEEKTWFGWDSYCITPVAFVIKCVAYFSFGFAAAAPFTVLWCLTREKLIPVPSITAPDGFFGGLHYMQFIQTWSLWLILLPGALGLIFAKWVLANESAVNPDRLIFASGVAAIIATIVFRMIRNAVILRFRCTEEAHSPQNHGHEIEQKDPTRSFLGDAWWKLPASVIGTLAALWALIEWFGVGILIEALK